MPLGLGSNLSRAGIATPGIVTDNLVLKHKYDAGSVIPISDGAAYFTGTGDRIILSSNIVHDYTASTTTYCFWANRSSVNSWDIVLGKNDLASNNFIIFDDDADRIAYESDTNDDSANGTISPAMSANKWHHFAVTANSATVAIYMDGVPLTMADTSIGDDVIINAIGGGANSSSNCFHGYICNVGIWSAILTQPQIKSIMNKNYAGLTDSEKTNLVSWWNLDAAYDIDDTTESAKTTQYIFDNHHGDGDTLGSDVMVGGDMSSDSGWTLETGWTMTDGKLRRDTTDSYNTAYRATSGLTEGKLYKVTVDVSTTNGNPLVVYLGEGHSGSITANVNGRTQVDGSIVFYLVAGANDNVYFYTGSGGTRWSGTIDNVIIKQVNGNHGVLT